MFVFQGTRYKRRGVDDEGNVANYVETEQVVYLCFSFFHLNPSTLYAGHYWSDRIFLILRIFFIIISSNFLLPHYTLEPHPNILSFPSLLLLYFTCLQIVRAGAHYLSFVQLRGSIPLYWSQAGIKYRPPPKLEKSKLNILKTSMSYNMQLCPMFCR